MESCYKNISEIRNVTYIFRNFEKIPKIVKLLNNSKVMYIRSGECEKLYNHPNHWGGMTTGPGILRSVYASFALEGLSKYIFPCKINDILGEKYSIFKTEFRCICTVIPRYGMYDDNCFDRYSYWMMNSTEKATIELACK